MSWNSKTRIQFGGHMRRPLGTGFVLLAIAVVAGSAAERTWQTGTWREIRVTRPRVVIGLQPSPHGPGPHTPTMTVVRTYVIEGDDQRFELTDIAPASRRTVDALVGEKVTFAVQKNTIYVRGQDGFEHRLRITKKIPKSGRE